MERLPAEQLGCDGWIGVSVGDDRLTNVEEAMEVLGSLESDTRDNYCKVVLQKQLWIPVKQQIATTEMLPDSPSLSPDLKAWSARQEAEKERIRRLDHTPQPPQRPPKKACLAPRTGLLTSAQETLGLNYKRPELPMYARSASEGTIGSRKSELSKQTSLHIEIGRRKVRPPVPPKPKLTKMLVKHNTEKVEVNDKNNETDKTDEVDRNENNKENTKRKTLIRSNYWQQQQALMDRSNTTNVKDIESEISANEEAGENLLRLVSENGTMSDVDRLRVHIKEVESVTNLLLVLHERLQRVEDELKQADDVKEKDNSSNVELMKKKEKILNQIEDAKKLKEFRDKRQETLLESLMKVLNSDSVVAFTRFLNDKVRLITLCRQRDSKMRQQENL